MEYGKISFHWLLEAKIQRCCFSVVEQISAWLLIVLRSSESSHMCVTHVWQLKSLVIAVIWIAFEASF